MSFYPASQNSHRKPPARGSGSRRGYGSTWWGAAWVHALEGRARLDPNRLPRGRSYARSGAVGELDIESGQVRAKVQGSRRKPYNVVVRIRTLNEAEWDRVLNAIAAQLGHTAALLDGELPPEVADDVAATGLDLLPGAGEVGPRCSCPDWADPCKHAAAVCYLIADELDRDPFALLQLRGRSRDEVLAGLRRRRSPAGLEPASPPPADQGVSAREAFDRPVAALPPVPLPRSHAGRPATLPVDPPVGSAVSREGLLSLAADAAQRAWDLATGSGDGGVHLDPDSEADVAIDLARRAAATLGTKAFDRLVAATGVPARELARTAIAWKAGGAGAVAAMRETWQPGSEELREGRAAVSAGDAPGAVRVWRNRMTRGDIQLRLGRDGLWYCFEKVRGDWEVNTAGGTDPSRLVESVRSGRARRPENESVR